MLSHKNSPKNEKILFLKRVFKNPRGLGAVLPSSKALADFIAQHAKKEEDDFIVEVGAGTGSFTRSLLENGVRPEQLIVVELDTELCTYLKAQFPKVTILQGNALDLETLLPAHLKGHVRSVISGIPLINLSKNEQQKLFASLGQVLHPFGQILQFTYGPISPFAHRRFGLKAKRLGLILKNIPPATVWQYTFSTIDVPYTRTRARETAQKTLKWVKAKIGTK